MNMEKISDLIDIEDLEDLGRVLPFPASGFLESVSDVSKFVK